jgi:transposase-like protein
MEKIDNMEVFIENLTEQEKNEMIKRFISQNKNKRRSDSKRPPLAEIAYYSDIKGLTTSQLGKKYGVKPGTIRVWRHLARKGEY